MNIGECKNFYSLSKIFVSVSITKNTLYKIITICDERFVTGVSKIYVTEISQKIFSTLIFLIDIY